MDVKIKGNNNGLILVKGDYVETKHVDMQIGTVYGTLFGDVKTYDNRTTKLKQEPIYLCYENYSASRKLIYIGQDYEDCLAQISIEYDLTKSDIESLRDDGQTHCYHAGVELSIEEQTLNCFTN